MMAPKPIVDAISKAIGVKENCTEQQTDKLPSLTLMLPDGKSLTLTPDDYMDTVVDGNDTFCWLHLMEMPPGPKGAIFVLGMPFLRTYYTTFDAEKHRVGFATPRQPTAVASKTSFPDVKNQGVLRGSGRIALHGRRPGEDGA